MRSPSKNTELLKAQFEFFTQNKYIYLDNASTTQVPKVVTKRICQSLQNKGNPGRGKHPLASQAESLLIASKKNIAKFIHVKSKELIFTNNTTDSINLAVEALKHEFKAGDEILISKMEHNSNITPFMKLIELGVKFKFIEFQNGRIDLEDLKTKLSSKTKAVVVSHCSNVFGTINPIQEIGQIIKEYNSDIIYFVDGAQAVAHIPVNVYKLQADVYSFSAHKMYGPDGLGVLFLHKRLHKKIQACRAGGGTVNNITLKSQGEHSEIIVSLAKNLSVLQGVTPNVSNVAGLSAAVDFIRSIGFEKIRKHELELTKYLRDELKLIPEIEFLESQDITNKIGLVSFKLKEFALEDLSKHMSEQNICLRYGSHCAFLLSDEIKSESMRISLGIYNTKQEVEKFITELKFFIFLKSGRKKSIRYHQLKNLKYQSHFANINQTQELLSTIKKNIKSKNETEIVIMAGHFLGVPDFKNNKFYPSIQNHIPSHLQEYLEEFGMTNHPLFTWESGCKIVSQLKSEGYSANLVIIANDTTGINELRLSEHNIHQKTAQNYRDELISMFQSPSIPEIYQKILKKYKLDASDIVNSDKEIVFRESYLRENFRRFAKKNKDYLQDILEYSTNSKKELDISIDILNNPNLKSCKFNTFQSKTGGKFCVILVAQFLAEIFGIPDQTTYPYISQRIKNSNPKGYTCP